MEIRKRGDAIMEYEIIESGSTGNFIIINKSIGIDMGISYKKINNIVKDLKLILLTHVHT